ncbi:CYTH domain-containing protein, partial [Serratia marcescens]|uniref:CYTH domain-containing protein n=1 Tax=Serratia marcescens TaxID=615 RepID=UPI0013DBCDB3
MLRDKGQTLERELKFAFAPSDLDKLKSLPSLAARPQSSERLLSIYFDTPAHALDKAGMSLRL